MEEQPRTLFISYCRRDTEFADRLAEGLKANGCAIWLDRTDIRPGEVWDATVQAALEHCTSLIVILSPASVRSQNVRDEINFAIKKKKEILPILYRDCEIPFRLDRFQRIDFRRSYDQGFASLSSVLRFDKKVSPDGFGWKIGRFLRHITAFSPRARRRALAMLALVSVAAASTLYLVVRMRPCLPRNIALHPYNDGIRAIRDGSYVRATINLEEAANQDPRNPMVHARLAEAWYDLDFLGDARREILAALTAEHCFSTVDSARMRAIQETIAADYSDAIRDYTFVLDHLSGDDASDGNVELGRVYESAGDVGHALQRYQFASELDPHNPAAFLRLGVLHSRMHHVEDADLAFDKAKKQIERIKDDELNSELSFELGYAIFDSAGKLDDAKALFNKALNGAEKLEHTQLRIRILTELSGVEEHARDFSNAYIHAQQAIKLAAPDLKPWAAIGYVRIANVYILQDKLEEAKEQLVAARELLQSNPQPRAQAAADFTSASIEAQLGDPGQSLGHAEAAFAYYSANRFTTEPIDAEVLIVQAQTALGNYSEAFQHLVHLQSESQRVGSNELRGEVAETAGNFYQEVEDYPKALENFYFAEKLNTDNQMWDAVRCAGMFYKLGDSGKANDMLALVPAGNAEEYDAGLVKVQVLLTQKHYRAALDLATRLPVRFPNIPKEDLRGITQLKAVAQAHLKLNERALDNLTEAATSSQKSEISAAPHQNQLIEAEVYLALGMQRDSFNSAINAANYFLPGNSQEFPRYESALRSACLAAKASDALHDSGSYSVWSKKCVDIQVNLKQHWGSESYQPFLSRPDIQDLLAPFPSAK